MKKSARQLDAEIAHAIAKQPRAKRPSREVVALFRYLADNAESYGAENLSLARRDEGYTGDPKEFRYSEIWARRLPAYKNSLLVDYINEAHQLPHDQLGRKLTSKEAEWMQREAEKIYDEEREQIENAIRERNR